ncbi:spermatogenesis-associated protein 31D4 [Tupaia chinensis]|uniref:spermatogenesis-associated protein 31D4 n=1 Tax=Tupaia chinensis TaxID=246437 RepID=UPI0003C8EC6E|nr:spermatogenesis-associated protein 31D4 [Tupaia chinensis]
MENILSYLKSYTEPGLSLGSVFLAVDPKLTFLSVLGLLLLYVCYLVLASLLSTLGRSQHTQKSQGRVKRRRKGETSRGRRIGWRKAEGERKLISILKSPLGPHHDSIRFRQLLCPDPLCEVCNRSTAEVNRLLDQVSMEEAAPSVSLLVSTTSMTESSIFLPSTLSSSPPADLTTGPLSEPSPAPASNLPPSLTTPSPDSLSPSPLSEAEPPEPVPRLDAKFPADSFPSSPSPFSRITPHHTQREDDSGLQPGVTFSQVDGPAGLPTSVPAVRDLDQSRVTISQVPLPPAKGSLSSNLAQSELKQELLTHHSSEAAFEKATTANMAESRNLSFLSPEGRQSQQKGNALIQKGKEKTTGSFSKRLSPDFQVSPSGKMSESIAAQQDSASSPPLSSEGEPEHLPVPEQSPYLKTDEDPLQKKSTSSLHRESKHPTVPVSGDSSSTFVLNGISKASITEEAPIIPHHQPQPMAEILPHPMSQTLPQFESKRVIQVQSKDHFQCLDQILPPSSQSQIMICGARFIRPQYVVQSLLPSEIDHLEWNVLKKEQESVWGLPSVVQSSQKDFCPSAPSLVSVSQSSKVQVRSSILPKDFPLISDIQQKLGAHFQKRFLQHQGSLPLRVQESLSQMNLQKETTETYESKSSYGLSCISLFKSQSSREIDAWGLSCPGSSHGKSSEMLLLGKPVGKDQEQSPEKGANDSLSSESKTFSDNNLVSNSKKDLEIPMVSLSENNSRTSKVSQNWKEIAKALEVHLSKKSEEIREGQMPSIVTSSWHFIKHTLFLFEKSHSQMTHRDLAPSLGGDQSLNTSEPISFISTSKQDLLEGHIKQFHMNMMHGLPPKVIKSIQIFNEKEDLFNLHFYANFSSPDKLISGVDYKSSVSKHQRESANVPYRDKVGRINDVPILDDILHSTSTAEKGGQGTLQQPASESSHKDVENIQGVQEGRQPFLPGTNSIMNKDSQKVKVLANCHSPELPTRQAETELELKDNREHSTDTEENSHDKRLKNLEHFLLSNMSREIFKAKELCGRQSLCNDILTTCGSEGFPMMERNLSKVENTQTTESSLQGMSDLQDPKSSDFKNHLLAELKFNLEIREQSQAHACSVDMSFAVDSLPDKAALNPAQDVSSRDVAPSPMLPVPLDDTRVFLDQPQETRAPNRDFLNTRIKKPKRDGRRVSPLVPKGELGGGGAILDPSGLRRTSHLPQGKVFPETQANKSLPSPTKKRQPPIESLFRKQMKHFFQWLCTNMKDKGQESSQEKGSSLSSPHSKGLVKRAVALSGTTKAQKYTAETSKFFEKKQGCRYKIQSTCPGEALSSPVKIDQTQHSAELHIREKPTQSCHSDYRAPSYKVTGTKSCSQGAASSVLSNPNETTRVREQNRQPQRIVALKDQVQCHRRFLSISHRETTSHRRSMCPSKKASSQPGAFSRPFHS